MAGKSRKAVKASVINEVNKEYKKKYEETFDRLKKDNEYYHSKNKQLFDENYTLKNENTRLKDENEKLKDWNTRLMAFMDLPEEDRNEAIRQYKAKKEADARLAGLINTFAPIFDCLRY